MIRRPPRSTLFPYTRSSDLIASQWLDIGVFHRLRAGRWWRADRKSTRLNSSHSQISYAVFCLKKKKMNDGKNMEDRAERSGRHSRVCSHLGYLSSTHAVCAG